MVIVINDTYIRGLGKRKYNYNCHYNKASEFQGSQRASHHGSLMPTPTPRRKGPTPNRRADPCLLVFHHQIYTYIFLFFLITIITTECWPTLSPRQKGQPRPEGQPRQQEEGPTVTPREGRANQSQEWERHIYNHNDNNGSLWRHKTLLLKRKFKL